MFILLGMNKLKTIDEIGKMLVSGALNDTKTIRKAGGDIFANVGLEKPGKNLNKLNCSPDCSPISPWI